MNHYSAERKESVIQKMMPPHNVPIPRLVEEDLASTKKAIVKKETPRHGCGKVKGKHTKTTARFHKREGKLKQLNSVSEELEKSQKEQEELEEQYSVVGSPSDVANGRNQYRTSLQRFVLGVLLDDVLVEAGQKLKSLAEVVTSCDVEENSPTAGHRPASTLMPARKAAMCVSSHPSVLRSHGNA